MWVLGISPSHDASAALVRDGVVVAAVAEERLSRIKGDGGQLPRRAIDHVLGAAGLTRHDVDCIALVADRFPADCFRHPQLARELERRLRRWRHRLRGRPVRDVSLGAVQRALARAGRDSSVDPYLYRGRFLAREGFRADAQLRSYDHHLAHAMAAIWGSGFEEAAVVTADGVGHLGIHHTSSVFRDGRLVRVAMSDDPGASAGWFYESITALLGFRPLRHEGKVLGLAAFGDPKPLYETLRRALRCAPSGRALTSEFVGQPRAAARRFAFLKDAIRGHPREDVAAAAQKVLEDAVLPLVQTAVEDAGTRHVALNGGIFANVRLNQHIGQRLGLDRLFVFPGMSDTGNSVGAAVLGLADLDGGAAARSRGPLTDVYWGRAYADDEIRAVLDAAGLAYRRLAPETLVSTVAHAIRDGLVVGWFQGRMEFGPRALGNRSIVATPVDAAINRRLNDRLSRTEFMPFAPSVLAGHAPEVFEGAAAVAHTAEFMTVTLDVLPAWRARIPAVVHVDGTARPHVVRRDCNPLYHDLIDRFRQLTGIPLVLNTSFNVHEEPIVCAPGEAVRAFVEDRVDSLAIGPFWVTRSERVSQ